MKGNSINQSNAKLEDEKPVIASEAWQSSFKVTKVWITSHSLVMKTFVMARSVSDAAIHKAMDHFVNVRDDGRAMFVCNCTGS